ncbi:MAG: hypothetical protein JJU11_02990 [Candidatus Sumerlaeia bacterium]|nr:hypothetical protein [Candidatus Sumerlaeia bacterium]
MTSTARHLREFLQAATYRRESVDRFLDSNAGNWACFDPELGYTLRDSFLPDGLDGCRTLQRYHPCGSRRMIQFADKPCRINTYGNSFTQGAQVSDGETWQEVLAAHLCEPIRNFGIGGHGVYQAVRRLRRHEATGEQADHLILTIWGDDHIRSINSWRWLTYFRDWNTPAFDHLFHSNPWDYARLDENTGELVEIPNAFNKPEDLYKLTDPEYVHEHFHADPIVNILAGLERPDLMDLELIERMAQLADWPELNFASNEARFRTAWRAYNAYGVAVTIKLLTNLHKDLASMGKKLLVVLAYPDTTIVEVCSGVPREETRYPDWHPFQLRHALRDLSIPFVDMLHAHLIDFHTTCMTPEKYANRYYIGHYNPTGNHFLAHSIRSQVVKWLDPKPPAYRENGGDDLIRYDGYLPGS